MTCAARALPGRPLFALAAMTTIALGVGAGTALFGVVDGVLLDPVPCEGPDGLVAPARRDETRGDGHSVLEG